MITLNLFLLLILYFIFPFPHINLRDPFPVACKKPMSSIDLVLGPTRGTARRLLAQSSHELVGSF